MTDIREELAREQQLRGSLEEAQSTLMQRIQDLEAVVDKERNEVSIYLRFYEILLLWFFIFKDSCSFTDVTKCM